MFKRKCYKKLLHWKNESKGSTALLIEGARRVGKTTLVKDFCTNEYSDYIYIDFSRASNNVLDLFNNYREDINSFLRALQLLFAKNLKPRKSAIIFDEVQRFPIAREYIKHLVADGRYDYIETGSLISIKKNVRSIIIPSEEERIKLNPIDFEEYLWANNLEVYSDQIKESYDKKKPLLQSLHSKLMRHFDEYMLVGGMPQAVNAFLESGTFVHCNKIKKQILNLYIDDLQKLTVAEAGKSKAIYTEIPGQLSSNSKRFKLASLDKNARYINYESAIFTLQDAFLVNICQNCNDPSVGFKLHANPSQFKCYMSDTGLLVSMAFDDGPESMRVYKDIQFGNISINKGMIVENMIAQQLVASGHNLYYHTWKEQSNDTAKSEKTMEIDFLISKGYRDAAGKLRICPIEVKTSKNYGTTSLDCFSKHWGNREGYEFVLHPKNLSKINNRYYLPLYMAFCL